MIKSVVLNVDTKPTYLDNEWRPSKTKGNFKLKHKTAMSVSLMQYQNDGLIENHSMYSIIKSNGLLMTTGLEHYPVVDNTQLLTIAYGPGTKGGELFFIRSDGKKQVIAKSGSTGRWTWISIYIPSLKSIYAYPLINGMKLIFRTRISISTSLSL